MQTQAVLTILTIFAWINVATVASYNWKYKDLSMSCD